MADHSRRGAANDAVHPLNSVRDAHDIEQHQVLRHDPSDDNANADIANDESFPASDAPSHTSAHHSGPAPSSMFNEAAERLLAVQRQEDAGGLEKAVHLDEIEASGGKTLGTMRNVLAISLVAIVLIFAVLLLVNR
jgi:hypothetical protein